MKPKLAWILMGPLAFYFSLQSAGAFAQTPDKEKPDHVKELPSPKLAENWAPKPLVFPSKDGLALRADLYAPHKDPKTPFIVLFHQAGWSRGEYEAIAPRLNRMGFNCMAMDQRSGNEVNGVINETAKRAKASKLATEYLDAKQDIEAALLYARKQLTVGTLLAWGSSYSSALVLQIAGEQPLIADGVLAFAPGEYFRTRGLDWVAKSAAEIKVPVFITSARDEAKNWKGIFDAIGTLQKTSYVPETEGHHGSSALWRKYEDSPGYWVAVTKFLEDFLPKDEKAAAQDKPPKKPPENEPPQEDPAPKERPRVE